MARQPRVHAPGTLYHVMLRGNGGGDIFISDDDRRYFESLVAEGVERFGHIIHAFCWMTNHVHLAIQVGNVPLSRIIQNLAFRHARWINRRMDRVGHLFQGRYKALLVDADRYLLSLVRYIHLNPVRAGLVETPDAHPWSSHRAYLGLDQISWLRKSFVLACFGGDHAESRRRYAVFVNEVPGDIGPAEDGARFPARDAWLDGYFHEPKAVLEAPVAKTLNFERIVAEVTRAFDVSEDQLLGTSREWKSSRARQAFAYLALSTGCGTPGEVSRLIHRDVATICNGVRRLVERCRHDEGTRALVDTLQKLLVEGSRRE